ncbi:MAG: hypothetical protein JEY99_14660 [Spirochaetales bacterium]|nr:hypothetical protein [Spirochaetales bacterium]
MNKKTIVKLVALSLLVLVVTGLAGCDMTNDMGRRVLELTNSSEYEVTSIEFDGRELVDASGTPYTIPSGGVLTITLEFVAEGDHSVKATDSDLQTYTKTVNIDDRETELELFWVDTNVYTYFNLTNNTGLPVFGYYFCDSLQTLSDLNRETDPVSIDSEFGIGFLPSQGTGTTSLEKKVDNSGYLAGTYHVYTQFGGSIFDDPVPESLMKFSYQGTVTITTDATNTFAANTGY